MLLIAMVMAIQGGGVLPCSLLAQILRVDSNRMWSAVCYRLGPVTTPT